MARCSAAIACFEWLTGERGRGSLPGRWLRARKTLRVVPAKAGTHTAESLDCRRSEYRTTSLRQTVAWGYGSRPSPGRHWDMWALATLATAAPSPRASAWRQERDDHRHPA